MSHSVFALPDLGEGLTEAEVVEWQVEVGEHVAVDQHVVVVETAKASVEVPCPYAGTVVERHGAAGQVVAVGSPLLTVEVADSAAAQPVRPSTAGAEQYREEERAGSGAVLVGYGTGGDARQRRRRALRAVPEPEAAPAMRPVVSPAAGPVAAQAIRVISPIVRRLARERGVDLASLEPSGPGGVVLRRDVEAAGASASEETAAAPVAGGTPAAAREERVPLTGVLGAMADRLSLSRRTIPDATTWVDADATGLLDAKTALAAANPDAGIGILALLARITVGGPRQ